MSVERTEVRDTDRMVVVGWSVVGERRWPAHQIAGAKVVRCGRGKAQVLLTRQEYDEGEDAAGGDTWESLRVSRRHFSIPGEHDEVVDVFPTAEAKRIAANVLACKAAAIAATDAQVRHTGKARKALVRRHGGAAQVRLDQPGIALVPDLWPGAPCIERCYGCTKRCQWWPA